VPEDIEEDIEELAHKVAASPQQLQRKAAPI
jgi:hypothetical protein